MKPSTIIRASLPLLQFTKAAELNLSTPLSSHIILSSSFKPPQVFINVNLLRNVNLEKAYVKEVVNVVIQNTDSKPQDKYYIPFEAHVVGNVGGLEVRDKKDSSRPIFRSELVEYDALRLGELNLLG